MHWDWWTYRAQPKRFITEVTTAMAAEATARKMERRKK
mgnify:FL=1